MRTSLVGTSNYYSHYRVLKIYTEPSIVTTIGPGLPFRYPWTVRHPIDGSSDNLFPLKLGHGGTFESI